MPTVDTPVAMRPEVFVPVKREVVEQIEHLMRVLPSHLVRLAYDELVEFAKVARQDLDEIDEPTSRAWIDAADKVHDSNDVTFDANAAFSIADDFVWVMGWCRVPNSELSRG